MVQLSSELYGIKHNVKSQGASAKLHYITKSMPTLEARHIVFGLFLDYYLHC